VREVLKEPATNTFLGRKTQERFLRRSKSKAASQGCLFVQFRFSLLASIASRTWLRPIALNRKARDCARPAEKETRRR
jgi:hypothetical protein